MLVTRRDSPTGWPSSPRVLPATVLALDQHVGLADGVGLVVEFLAVHRQPCLRVVLLQAFAGRRQHAAGAGGGGWPGWGSRPASSHAALHRDVFVRKNEAPDKNVRRSAAGVSSIFCENHRKTIA